MKTLWAPWRLPYLIESSREKRAKPAAKGKGACVFCAAARAGVTEESLVVHEGELAFVIMNKYPYANGHLMVLPFRHVADYTRLTRAEHAEMGGLIAASVRALKRYARCDGFNVGMNLGEAAGAGIKDHLHYHVVPRWSGDHNFMPVIGDARVVPEDLRATRDKLLRCFR